MYHSLCPEWKFQNTSESSEGIHTRPMISEVKRKTSKRMPANNIVLFTLLGLQRMVRGWELKKCLIILHLSNITGRFMSHNQTSQWQLQLTLLTLGRRDHLKKINSWLPFVAEEGRSHVTCEQPGSVNLFIMSQLLNQTADQVSTILIQILSPCVKGVSQKTRPLVTKA